jgi:hypothetical protein
MSTDRRGPLPAAASLYLRAAFWLCCFTLAGGLAALALQLAGRGRVPEAWVAVGPGIIGAARAATRARPGGGGPAPAGARLLLGLYLAGLGCALAWISNLGLGWIYDVKLTFALLVATGLLSAWYFLGRRR